MRKLSLIATIICLTLVGCQKDDSANLAETLTVKNDGAQMPVYVYGNGASKNFILLVHGGPGGNGLEYRFGTYAEILEEKVAVAYWDQRGQGMAQGHYSLFDVTVSQMVEDLRAVVLTMKAHYGQDSKIFILGHSWGGTLSAAFMVDSANQQLVDGWIEADGAHDIPLLNRAAVAMFNKIGLEQILAGNSVDEWTEIYNWSQRIDTNNITFEQGGEINENAFKAEDLLYQDGVIASSDFVLPTIFSPTNRLTSWVSGRFTSIALSEEIEFKSLTDELSNITIPCLFLWGEYDFVVPKRLGISAFNRVNALDKELIIFNQSGHSPMDPEAELFAAEILEFIDRND